MSYLRTRLGQSLVGLGFTLLAGAVQALPALQLGPSSIPSTDWSWDAGTETWVYEGGVDTSANLAAFANADTAGANGAYAWENSGGTQTAYLVVAATPAMTGTRPAAASMTTSTTRCRCSHVR